MPRPYRVSLNLHTGLVYKQCFGPLHGSEGIWLPVESEFYKRGSPRYRDRPRTLCKKCTNLYAYNGRVRREVYVRIDEYWFIFEELARRIGPIELCRRLGCSNQAFYDWRKRKWGRFHKRYPIAAVKILVEIRNEQYKMTDRRAMQIREEKRKQKWRESMGYVTGS